MSSICKHLHACKDEFIGQHAQAMVACRLVIAKLTMAVVYCRVKTPNYELYGAMTVDIRVGMSGEGWTVNKIQFTYFANTSAKNCLAYGPGLLPQVVPSCLSCLLGFYRCMLCVSCGPCTLFTGTWCRHASLACLCKLSENIICAACRVRCLVLKCPSSSRQRTLATTSVAVGAMTSR